MRSLIRFFEIINRLKHTERQGWIDRSVPRPRDTIASHSFGSALIGWLLARQHQIAPDRVVRMLLIHDLMMAEMADITPRTSQYEQKQQLEERAFRKLLKVIPIGLRNEFKSLFDEYQRGRSRAARIARQADKLDTLLQARIYSKLTGKNFVAEFVPYYLKYFSRKHSQIRELQKI